jgi:hypothetical protein
MKLFSVAVPRCWMQIARLRRLSVLLQFICGQGPEPVGERKAVRCAQTIVPAAKYTMQSYILQQVYVQLGFAGISLDPDSRDWIHSDCL